MFDACAGYGGALSVYFGLSTGLQLLNVSFFNLALHRNVFTRCSLINCAIYGGNLYGGGVSVYMGGYSASSNFTGGAAVAAIGDTIVRNISIIVDTAVFTTCMTKYAGGFLANLGNNVYGGSFSFYVGAYILSASSNLFSSSSISSSSTSGLMTASDVLVFINNANSSDCSTIIAKEQYGGGVSNIYGGSMNVVHIGAFARASSADLAFSIPLSESVCSSSVCGTTNVTGLVVSISNSTFANSSAVSSTVHITRLFSIPLS